MDKDDMQIHYDREKVDTYLDKIKECRKELAEIDELFYKGIMTIGYAKGINLIAKQNPNINLLVPEKLMEECKESSDDIIKEISLKIDLVNQLDRPSDEYSVEQPGKIQYREDTEVQPAYGVRIPEGVAQPAYGVQIPEGIAQPAYGIQIPEGIAQPAYGIQIPEGIAQPAYGIQIPEGIAQPAYGIQIPEGIAQPAYGIQIPEPIMVQPAYGIQIPEPITVQPAYGVQVPEGIAQPAYGISVPEMHITQPVMPEYESIPDTGISGGSNNLIGGIASGIAAGVGTLLVGSKLNKKDDEE